MAKTWAVKVAIPQDPVYETYIIAEGDDWDGRPVANEYDASDLAYDKAYDDFPDVSDIEVVEVWKETA